MAEYFMRVASKLSLYLPLGVDVSFGTDNTLRFDPESATDLAEKIKNAGLASTRVLRESLLSFLPPLTPEEEAELDGAAAEEASTVDETEDEDGFDD